jgi:hypothetical protein
MKKPPTRNEYLAQLGDALPEFLPQGFVRVESTTPSFMRQRTGRTEHIRIRLLTHHWPYGVLDLTFGVSYDAFQEMFTKFINEDGLQIPHIYHDTFNIHQMEGLRYMPRILFTKIPMLWRFIQLGGWTCQRDESPRTAILRTKKAIKGVIDPFFSRFSDIQEAWISLRDNDGWSLQGWHYRTVLAYGIFLGDNDGVEIAKKRLTAQYNEEGAAEVDEYLNQIRAFLQIKTEAQQAAS